MYKNKYPIHNKEKLFRSIDPHKNLYSIIDGKLRLSSQAFNDPRQEPSVDRADLCTNNPQHTKKSEKADIVFLLTHEIRNEKIFCKHPDRDVNYNLDVKAKPNKKNKAHAVIMGVPPYKSSRAFNKVKERLALLAEKNGWSLKPIEE